MSRLYQRVYVNGAEVGSSYYQSIYSYSQASLDVIGFGSVMQELLVYNYDMMQHDFESAAVDELNVFRLRTDEDICLNCSY